MLIIVLFCFVWVWEWTPPGLQNLSHADLRVALSIWKYLLMMSTWQLVLLANEVICIVPWFQPIVDARWWNNLTKMMVWSGVMAKPLVSALSSSDLYPCSKMVDPLFVEQLIRSLAPSFRGLLAKTTVAEPAGGTAVAAGAMFCNATICAWRAVMMAMSLAVVGVGVTMFA